MAKAVLAPCAWLLCCLACADLDEDFSNVLCLCLVGLILLCLSPCWEEDDRVIVAS